RRGHVNLRSARTGSASQTAHASGLWVGRRHQSLIARGLPMAIRRRSPSERGQLNLFRALPGDFAPRDAQDLMAYPFFSLAKSHRLGPIGFAAGNMATRVEAVAAHGMATIWDADILIWAASQIVEARDTGLRTS